MGDFSICCYRRHFSEDKDILDREGESGTNDGVATVMASKRAPQPGNNEAGQLHSTTAGGYGEGPPRCGCCLRPLRRPSRICVRKGAPAHTEVTEPWTHASPRVRPTVCADEL